MSDVERWREPRSELPSAETMRAKRAEGWRLVALEWERSSSPVIAEGDVRRPIPYGLRISSDCRHLEVDPTERELMTLLLAMIAGDEPLSAIARVLNRKGFRTREGRAWTQVGLFQMLPRLIEVGPEILSDDEWPQNKKKLLAEVSGTA